MTSVPLYSDKFIFKLLNLTPAYVSSVKVHNKKLSVRYYFTDETAAYLLDFNIDDNTDITSSILHLDSLGNVIQEWKFQGLKNFKKEKIDLDYKNHSILSLEMSFEFEEIIVSTKTNSASL